MSQDESAVPINVISGEQQLVGPTHRQRGVFPAADPLGTVNATLGSRGQLSHDEIDFQIERFGGEK